MNERSDLLESIAKEIGEYRNGDVDITPGHVDRWASQFTPENQLAVLNEFNHVIKTSFLTRDNFISFLSKLSVNSKLVGPDPVSFWKSVNFLNVQINGASQNSMLELLSWELDKNFTIDIDYCGSKTSLSDFLCEAGS